MSHFAFAFCSSFGLTHFLLHPSLMSSLSHRVYLSLSFLNVPIALGTEADGVDNYIEFVIT